MTTETGSPEYYEKVIISLVKIVSEQSDTIKYLVDLLTPEARSALAKIGKLVEKSAPPPVNIV